MPAYSQQPTDPDAPSASHSALPTARQVGAVWAGGAVGSGLRALVELMLPGGRGFPAGTLAVNLTGALLLGALIQFLALAGDDSGTRLRARLLLGTGVLGGFTTYSTFAVESVGLIRDGATGAAALYVATTVAGGTVAAWAGMSLARTLRAAA